MKHSINVFKEAPNSESAQEILNQLSKELKDITGNSGRGSFNLEDVYDQRSVFVMAKNQHSEIVGCGALREMDDETAEIKRVYAKHKGEGIGGSIVVYLETCARNLGYLKVCLETRVVNKKAVCFYESKGYNKIPNYGKYVGREEAICFQKDL